jgi:biotin transport system substrate-specific component
MKTKSLVDTPIFWHQLAAVTFFVVLTALTARLTISLPFTPVPITLQTLAVILSGLVLGARGGAMAQLVYLGTIAVGLPVDAKGLGPIVFFSPTAGYLIGFVLAAFVTGWLAQYFRLRSWRGRFIAALAGVPIIYLIGASWLAVMLGSWTAAFWNGVAPFILIDLVKAACAAALVESGNWLIGKK